MPTKELALKNATVYITYILLAWGFYRLLFQLPEQIEETFIKPIVWLVPLLILINKERVGLGSLGFGLNNLFSSIYYSIGLGTIFVIEGLLVNYAKYGELNFGANIGSLPFMTTLLLSFITAVTEEIVFRGYVFNRIWYAIKNEWRANLLSTLAWTAVHTPIVFFVWRLDMFSSTLYLFLISLFGIASAFVFARTKNIISSILLHVLWAWPIILFR